MDAARLTFDTAWSPEFDSLGAPPKSTLAILSTPRTGSQTLCRLLCAMGIGVPAEYFLNRVMDRFGERFLNGAPTVDAAFARRYTEAIQAFRCRNGFLAYKIHADQHRQLTADLGTAWESTLPGLTVIRLRRRDPVAQIISLGAALQTGIWDDASGELIKRPSTLSEAVAEKWTEYIFRSEQYWDRYLAHTEHRVLTMFCEDLADADRIWATMSQLDIGVSKNEIDAILGRLPRSSRNRELTQELTQRFSPHISRHWQRLSAKAGAAHKAAS